MIFKSKNAEERRKIEGKKELQIIFADLTLSLGRLSACHYLGREGWTGLPPPLPPPPYPDRQARTAYIVANSWHDFPASWTRKCEFSSEKFGTLPAFIYKNSLSVPISLI
jgi:hypothetical protein